MLIYAALQDLNWLGLNLLDWLVLGLYFVIVVGIGFWSYRKVKDMSDYFMGGRRFGKIFMMFFAFGAGTSSEQAISVVAGTWRVGLAGIWWQFLWLWATPFYWIVAPVMRRMRALTTADFFQHRFDTSTATLYSLYGIIMSIVFMAGGLYGSGKMVNALTGGELERMAEEIDFFVPVIKWNQETNRFGRGILFDTKLEFQHELHAGRLPEELRQKFREFKRRLSDNVVVTSQHARDGNVSGWWIQDARHNIVYSARRITEMETVDGKKQKVTKLRIYDSGWRRLEGYEYAILAMTVIFVIYGMAGGLGAAIITDFIQGMLTIAFSFLLLPFVFHKIGGFGMLHQNGDMKEGMLDLVASLDVAASLGREPITVFYVFMLSLTALCGIVVHPHIMGVCGAGKTEMEGRFGFTFGNFLKRFCTMAWTFTGLACIVWYLGAGSPLLHKDKPDPSSPEFRKLEPQVQKKILQDRQLHEDLQKRISKEELGKLPLAERQRIEKVDHDFADQLFGRAAYDILPIGLIGLLLASLLAAVMSTSDAQMVVSSGLFTENIYKRFLVRGASQAHYLWVGRLAGLTIVLLALILQASFTDVIDALKVIIKTPAAIGISLWFGVIWRRWTPLAVWGSTLCSAAVWAFVAYRPDILRDWGVPAELFNTKGNLLDAWQMVAYLGAGVSAGIVLSFLTPRVKEEKLDKFFTLIHTPIKPGEKPEAPCSLPAEHLPPEPKLLPRSKTIELPRPTWVDIGGFLAAWACVAAIIWLTSWLAHVL